MPGRLPRPGPGGGGADRGRRRHRGPRRRHLRAGANGVVRDGDGRPAARRSHRHPDLAVSSVPSFLRLETDPRWPRDDTYTTAGAPPCSSAVAVVAGVALLVFGGGAFAAIRYEHTHANRIMPGVTIAGVDVSGMTRAQALESVRASVDRTALRTADGHGRQRPLDRHPRDPRSACRRRDGRAEGVRGGRGPRHARSGVASHPGRVARGRRGGRLRDDRQRDR